MNDYFRSYFLNHVESDFNETTKQSISALSLQAQKQGYEVY